ncbi:hypothetical protein [Orrella marina]|nr:hypothetical protein [Orrella marina]
MSLAVPAGPSTHLCNMILAAWPWLDIALALNAGYGWSGTTK